MSYSSDDEESECKLHPLFDDLDNALWHLTNSQGSFAFKRTHASAPNPTLRIEGLGRVGLPLSDEAVKAVTAQCEPPSVGVGVRGAWEMAGPKVASDNQEWHGFVRQAVGDVCEALGVNQALSKPRCDLYKLVVHEPTTHNLPQVTVEKAANVFATVVFILPTEFTGGDVHALHGSRSMVANTSEASLTKTTVLAWYTGVAYELKPITSGMRLALVYNLVHTTASPVPMLKDNSKAMEQLCDVLRRWNSGLEDAPDRMVLGLDEEYPKKKTLTARSLKGYDVRAVAVLDEAAMIVGLGMGLAIFRHSVFRRVARCGGGYAELDDEVNGHSKIGNLVDLEGRLLRAKEMWFDDHKKNISPPIFLEELTDGDPDFEDFDDSDYGRGDLEQCYSKPVLVLWPTWGELAQLPGERRAQGALERLKAFDGQKPTPEIEQAFTYVAQSNRKDSLPTLCDLARRWERADLWRGAILAFGDEDCNVEIIAALERFGFEALESTIGEFVRALPPSKSAARAFILESVRVWTRKNANPSVHAAVDASYRK